MPEGMGPLSPSFERLLTMGFAHLAPGPVTVLTTTSEEDQPRFELPSSWRAAQGPSWQELSVCATRLLPQGPLLLVPPWQRRTGTGGGRSEMRPISPTTTSWAHAVPPTLTVSWQF